MCGLRAEVGIQQGRYDAARAECEAALRYARELGALTEIPVLQARIADIWHRQGDDRRADELAEQALQDAGKLGVTDAQAYALLLRVLVAAEAGDTVRARSLYLQMRHYVAIGTPPSVIDVTVRVLNARLTAAESALPGSWPLIRDALDEIRTALRSAVALSLPEALHANAVLTAAYAVLCAGRPHEAVRLADTAAALRGGLTASAPDGRLDSLVRTRARHAAGTGAPGGAGPGADTAAVPGADTGAAPDAEPGATTGATTGAGAGATTGAGAGAQAPATAPRPLTSEATLALLETVRAELPAEPPPTAPGPPQDGGGRPPVNDR